MTDKNEPPVLTGESEVDYVENDTAVVATYTATDPEGDAISLVIVGDDASHFTLDDDDGELRFNSPPDYESKNSYSITLRATETQNPVKQDDLDVTVTITDVDEPPVFTGENSFSIVENSTGIKLEVGPFFASDPEGAATTLSLSGTDSDDFDLEASGYLSLKASPDYETKSSYSVTVTASDGTNDVDLDVTVSVTDVNEPPVLTGDSEVSYAENGEGVVASYTATDPENAAITWTVSDDNTFSISEGALSFASPPDYETYSSHSILVFASDGTNGVELAVTVSVTDVNEPPIIQYEQLAPDPAVLEFNEGDGGRVGRYDAFDSEGDELTGWTLAGADSEYFTLDIYSDASATLYFNVDYDTRKFLHDLDYDATAVDANGDNVFEAILKNGSGDFTSSLSISVTLKDVNEPLVLTGDSEVDYAEDGTAVVATYVAADPENAAITWSLGGDDADDFTISEGALSFASAPDYESPTDSDSDNDYEVKISASDGTHTVSVDLTVTVTDDANEPPVLTGDSEVDYEENDTAVVATFTASDPENGAITWSLGGDDADDFTISDGKLSFASAPDYESPTDSDSDNDYEVTIKASDGTHTVSVDLTVTVTDVDETPVLTGDSEVDYAENGTAVVATYAAADPENGAITWSLSGDDADDFTISEGALSFASSPDYESPADSDSDNDYEVTISASDGTYTVSVDLTVTVTDVDETLALTGDSEVDYEENGTAVVATFTAADPEDGAITWSLSGDDAGDFTISEGKLSFASAPNYESPADSDSDNDYEVTISASDGTHTVSVDLTVTVTDDADEAPVITGDSEVDYAENSTAVVATYSATDPEGAATTLTLGGTDAGSFRFFNRESQLR